MLPTHGKVSGGAYSLFHTALFRLTKDDMGGINHMTKPTG